MPAFLITGNPGSGKTSVARQLARRGYAAFDADEVAGWETASGTAVAQPPAPTDEWLLSHRWVWFRARLEALVSEHSEGRQPVFVCGIAMTSATCSISSS